VLPVENRWRFGFGWVAAPVVLPAGAIGFAVSAVLLAVTEGWPVEQVPLPPPVPVVPVSSVAVVGVAVPL